MARGIGRAMESALSPKERGASQPVRESLLMHPQRRELFRLLCLRPCATASELARQAGLSANAARWHLQRLAVAGLVVRGEAEAAYYPRGLIDPRDGPLFRVLAEGTARDVFRAVVDAPGSTQREVCGAVGVSRQAVFRAATRLVDQKLLSFVEDGRYRRYYPTDLLGKRQAAHAPHVKSFVESLLKALEAGGLAPQVLRRTNRQLLLRIGRGRPSEVLELTLDPFTTVLE